MTITTPRKDLRVNYCRMKMHSSLYIGHSTLPQIITVVAAAAVAVVVIAKAAKQQKQHGGKAEDEVTVI